MSSSSTATSIETAQQSHLSSGARRTERAVLLVLTPLLLVLAVIAARLGLLPLLRPHTFHGLQFEPPLQAADFLLTSQDEQPVRLSDYQGKAVVLVFGYTQCPDACPATLANLDRALRELGDRGGEVQVLLVSVDPERDTPGVLKEYLRHFNRSFVGLTGSPAEVEAVQADYWVQVEKEQAGLAQDHLLAHTARTVVIDRAGRLALTFPLGMAPQEMAADLDYLLSH